MKDSPTKRTLARLRAEGYSVEVVEHWNAFSQTRKDLFGIIDILAIGKGETVAVQCTSSNNVAARIKKIEDSPNLPYMRSAGWKIQVDGWKKDKRGYWVCRTVDVS